MEFGCQSHWCVGCRAGADYGLMILGFVVLATLLKYHSFEYVLVMQTLHKQVSLTDTKNLEGLHYGYSFCLRLHLCFL